MGMSSACRETKACVSLLQARSQPTVHLLFSTVPILTPVQISAGFLICLNKVVRSLSSL